MDIPLPTLLTMSCNDLRKGVMLHSSAIIAISQIPGSSPANSESCVTRSSDSLLVPLRHCDMVAADTPMRLASAP
ncbi:TPA: hypothetical protein ACOEOI_001317 [Stenotrophomonas maltophilia]